MCPLTKSGFGSPTRPSLDARFEKSQNFVSTKIPEVIGSLRASCNGNGIPVVVRVATSQWASFQTSPSDTRGLGEAGYL